MSLTYDRYNQYLGKYFGNLITQTFYDEPSMHHADRMWTPDFNAAFQKRYGYSPMKYYPALWYDIGPQTAAARDALFGFRATLYEENYIKWLNDWCRGAQPAVRRTYGPGGAGESDSTHRRPDQNVQVSDHSNRRRYLVVWAARTSPTRLLLRPAFNYDHRLIRAETYAAYAGLTDKIAFQVAMDQYAMGINSQVAARRCSPSARS